MKGKFYLLVSLGCGLLIYLLVTNSKSYISYVLRVPGYFLQHYLPLFVSIQLGGEVISLSVMDIAIYSFVVYAIVKLISRIRGNKLAIPSE